MRAQGLHRNELHGVDPVGCGVRFSRQSASLLDAVAMGILRPEMSDSLSVAVLQKSLR